MATNKEKLIAGAQKLAEKGQFDRAIKEYQKVVATDDKDVRVLLKIGELHVVPGMHERKAMMARLSAGFLTLPGGVGTFEEFFEILTWATLGLHTKPIGLLNVGGYFDPLLALLEHSAAERFTRPEHLALLLVSSSPESLAADLLQHAPPPPGPKWIELDET